MTQNSKTQSESTQLLAIKQRYKESLLDKAEYLSIWSSRTGRGIADYQELAAWLHKVAGSAGMYGYEELAEKARQLMQCTENFVGDTQESVLEDQTLLDDVQKFDTLLRKFAK